MVMKTRKCIFVTPLFLCALVSCTRERGTTVEISGSTQPVFHLKGDGTLARFSIYAPPPGSSLVTAFDPNQVIWAMAPEAGYFKGEKVRDLTLQYGRLEDGYAQLMPANGTTPPKLEMGKIYFYWAETANAAGKSGYFELTAQEAKEVSIPNLCVEKRDGKMQNVTCDSHTPFVWKVG
jgi:hypothetical protein